MRPDRSKILDLFESDLEPIHEAKPLIKNKSKKPPVKNANEANKSRFELKLEEELFSEFDYKDWFQYFVWKAKSHGIKYITRNYAKEYAIIKSILNELSWQELKMMIDFVFDSGQDIADKRTVGLWILSKGWINTIYQSANLWRQGKYRPKNAPTRNREWVAEASRKESGTGLHYGKPIREDDDEPKKEKKTVIKKGSIRL